MNPKAAEPELPAQLGPFRTIGILGYGGSGIVYDALWDDRAIALKVLHPTRIATERDRRQFFAEAGKLKDLHHPSIVAVHAVGELDDGRPYIAMERLHGETLSARLAVARPGLDEALRWFGQLADAVGSLHDRGLVHRDVKPENVFVTDDGRVVLLDFGIAKELDALPSTTTQDGGVRGTPAYMAPERFFGQPAQIATDVYELAVTLYAMLAGRLPWDQVVDPEARLNPRSLIELGVAVPPTFDVELRRALSTRVANRHPSVRALHEALEHAAADGELDPSSTAPMRRVLTRPSAGSLPPPVRMPVPAETPRRASTQLVRAGRRRWGRVVVAVAVLAVIAALAWWLTHRGSSSPPTPTPSVSRSPAPSPPPPSGDPWAATPVPKGPSPEAVEWHQQMRDARARLPVETHFVISAVVHELLTDPTLAPVLTSMANTPALADIASQISGCRRDLLTTANWVVFGASGQSHLDGGLTFIANGDWPHATVEECTGVRNLDDAPQQILVGVPGWIGWIDDHTFMAVMRSDFTRLDMAQAMARRDGPAPRVVELLGALPADAAVAIALDSKDDESFIDADVIPAGTDVAVELRVDDGLGFNAVVEPRTDVQAADLKERLERRTKAFDPTGGKLATFAIGQRGRQVTVDGHLTQMAIAGLGPSMAPP